MTEAQRKRISLGYAVMYTFLRRIAAYQTPDRLRKHSGEDWGVGYEKALEMAYENVLGEAKAALKQVRKPFVEKGGKRGAMTDEKYVRARWERIALEWGTIEHKRYVSVSASGMFITLHGYETEAEAWSGARAFTEQRERDIAEVQEEIEYVSSFAWLPSRSGKREEHPVWQRILAVEQARLAELRRGMKEGSE